ncbi:MAG: peptidase sortase [Candidatus Adlerbacteria bacterium]|nr:peptidase sortase [Candidatus Adlerbacteria bacterium]
MTTNKAVLAATLVSAALFGAILVHATVYAPDDYAPPNVAAATSSPIDPVRISIPSLSIDAAVQHVGINTKGNVGTPNNFTDVAWYQGSVAPGALGTAILDGHVDNGLQLAGVFKHLADITVGSDIYISAKNGTRLHFKVRDIVNYPYTAVPMADMLAQDLRPEIALITCEGAWVAGEKTYDHRLVVYATLASP